VGGTGVDDGAACALLRCTTDRSGSGDAIGVSEEGVGFCEVTTGSATGCNPDACATLTCDGVDWPTGVAAVAEPLLGCGWPAGRGERGTPATRTRSLLEDASTLVPGTGVRLVGVAPRSTPAASERPPGGVGVGAKAGLAAGGVIAGGPAGVGTDDVGSDDVGTLGEGALLDDAVASMLSTSSAFCSRRRPSGVCSGGSCLPLPCWTTCVSSCARSRRWRSDVNGAVPGR